MMYAFSGGGAGQLTVGAGEAIELRADAPVRVESCRLHLSPLLRVHRHRVSY
jgi:hypothetical protein